MLKTKSNKNQSAWVVAVDMGYGHLRPAYSLAHLTADGQIIVANNYTGIPWSDKKIWQTSRRLYEFISRFTHVPLLGGFVFSFFDRLQKIPNFYPRRDLSRPTQQVKQIYRLIRHQKWGKHLIDKLAKQPRPLVTTFFTVAFMAEEFSYPGEIFCLATDTDITRAWVPLKPRQTKIKYLAPSYRVRERLVEYGVPKQNIFLTGFPLPKDNLGGLTLKTLRQDLAQRLINLDPQHRYRDLYWPLVSKKLKISKLPTRSHHPLTITFAVGGAGAQREIGALIMASLRDHIRHGEIRLVLIAGVHNKVSTYFKQQAKRLGLISKLGTALQIIYATTKDEYFKLFNETLRTTDILWTKPSELSFYCALGIPIIMTPPIGSQEVFNRQWLRTLGVAANQFAPEYTAEWLSDWVGSGWCAEAAVAGFLEAPKFGTYNIEKIIAGQGKKLTPTKITLQY